MKKGGNNRYDRVVSPESVSRHLKVYPINRTPNYHQFSIDANRKLMTFRCLNIKHIIGYITYLFPDKAACSCCIV